MIPITGLTAITSLDDSDLMVTVDVSDGVLGTKKITLANMRSSIIRGALGSAASLTLTAGLTVSAGTTAVQAVTCTTLTTTGVVSATRTTSGDFWNAIYSAAIKFQLEVDASGNGAFNVRNAGGTAYFNISDAVSIIRSTGTVLGATALLASERLRVAGGTMGTPGATDVLLAAGKVSCGDTSATSIQTAGGITAGGLISAAGATITGATPGIATTAQVLIGNGVIKSGNFVFVGSAGTGTGGNVRYLNDTGTAKWLTGLLGTGGATSYDLYDLVNADIPLSVSASAGGAITLARPVTCTTLTASGGTMTAPSSTQVILAAGKLSCGDTSATSIQTAGGITLGSGKVLTIGATQVVGAKGAAVIDATDAASVITQLNALLARCRAHGLIA